MSRIVECAGRLYAVGLWWQIRSGGVAGKKAMLKSAQEMAAHFECEGYTHAALRAKQYGLGRHDGPKTFSLAVALRPRQDAFLGVFCLDDSENPLWWVCSILRGFVVADGDAVFDSKDKAVAAAAELRLTLDNTGLTEVTLDTLEESWDYLRPLLEPETPLVPLFKKKCDQRLGLLIGAIAALLALGCGGLYWLYSGYQNTQKAEHRALQLAAQESKRRDIQAHPERYFKSEWLTAPSALAAGGQCAKALMTLPLSANAWRFEEAVCRPASRLTAVWAHVKGASFVALPPGAALTSPGQAATERALSALPGRPPSSLPLLTRDQAAATLYDLTQSLTAQLVLSWDAPEQYKIDEATTVSAPWQRGQFELTQVPVAALLESGLFEALGRYPGTMVLSLSRKSNELTLKGCIYANTAQR